MIRFVDFEASSLGMGSFPIEIAWVDENVRGECHLIRPADTWLGSVTHTETWDPASERLHGISPATLMRDGVPHDVVARRAAEALTVERGMAFADSPPSDGHWLHMLLGAAGMTWRGGLVDVHVAYGRACRPLLDLLPPGHGPERVRADGEVRTVAAGIIARAVGAEAMWPRTTHRALPDAESLWRTWRAVGDEVARLVAGEAPT